MAQDKLNISALSPGDLATLFSRSLRRPVTEQQVRDIAEAGNLLSESDSINLIEYTGYVAGEITFASTN